LSEENENGIQDVSLIAHQLADVIAELENVVGQFKL
jgi:methyl-accepting chemotaxis protein